jgi:hypothetical protein
MVEDILNEAVRDLNRFEGAKHLGGLRIVLKYRSKCGIIFDAAVVSERDEHVAIEIRHSYSKVTLMEMSLTLHQIIESASKTEDFKFLFISNQEPVNVVDVEYLKRVRQPETFDYVQVTEAKDLPKIFWAIRAAFQIHG